MSEEIDWRKPVVYQTCPRLFSDTTRNGIRDISGITEKSGYVKSLSVDYVWLAPVYESPMNDNGYDISNYLGINEDLGTMGDSKKLVKVTHQEDLRVMLNIVINHASTEHEWFKEACKSKDNPCRDYYLFRSFEDGPSMNWYSKFSDNAWKYDSETDEYYLHLFDVSQTDSNWDSPEVRQSLYCIANHWTDFGVDGLQFDVVNLISKGEFEDSDKIGKGFYTDGPRVHELLHKLNHQTLGNTDMMTVREISSTTTENCIKYTQPERQELNNVFNFHHLKVDYADGEKRTNVKFDFHKLKEALMQWQRSIYDDGGWNAIFWCNHDQSRVVSRFGDDTSEEMRIQSAKMLAIALHVLQGTSCIYQGEEIGMTDLYSASMAQYRDAGSINAYYQLLSEGHVETDMSAISGWKS